MALDEFLEAWSDLSEQEMKEFCDALSKKIGDRNDAFSIRVAISWVWEDRRNKAGD